MISHQSVPKILDCRSSSVDLDDLVDSGFEVRLWEWRDLEEFEPDVILADRFEAIPEEVHSRFSLELQKHHVGIVLTDESQASESPHQVHWNSALTTTELCQLVRLLAHSVRQTRTSEHGRQQLMDWAFSDVLTDCPNRRAWNSKLQECIATDDALCLAIIDIDFFKRVNSLRGHAVGDTVLAETAVAIKRYLRANDFVARLGGDEFGLLLSGVTCDVAAEIIDRLRENVHQHLASKGIPAVTISAGYAFSAKRRQDDDAKLLYQIAATSLQQAKQSEKNCIVGHVV